MKKIIVTGGSGFIGSNLIEYLIKKKYFVINIDKLSYAANSYNLINIDKKNNVIFVCSSAARMVWKDENLPSFGETIEKWKNTSLFKMYSNNDFYSPIASGTFKTKGMIIVPTSMNTIAAISNGISDNLIKSFLILFLEIVFNGVATIKD